jgi:hypothetical protein
MWVRVFPRNAFLPGLICLAGLSIPVPAPAQDMPELTGLPVISAPGTLGAGDLVYQAAWLSVQVTGVYNLGLDGPGGLAISRYATADGRTDGSAAVTRLAADGTLMRAGELEDMLLVAGQAYLVQIAGDQPRGLVLRQQEDLGAGSGPWHNAGEADPLALTPGQEVLLHPGGVVRIRPESALRLIVLTPPGLGASAAS